MDAITRIERTLDSLINRAEAPGCPPRLAAAMRHAVFPRGSRIRPRLCLAVAAACGEADPAVTDAAAAAIELMHCASLVHDDLPCFDNAATRRGRPSVHAAFGVPQAVLAGDALIVLAFQGLAWGAAAAPDRLAGLVAIIAGAVGVPRGIAAGQAWECEPAATEAGAICGGRDPAAWRPLGLLLGEAYQAADDLLDVAADPAAIGKPVGQDQALGRPNLALTLGMDGAIDALRRLATAAVDAVPSCPGEAGIRAHILSETQRLVPRQVAARAA